MKEMNDDLKYMLAEWSDPLGSRTMTDAEDLIHALQVEIGGMEGRIKALEDDLKYYKELMKKHQKSIYG